MKGWTALDQLGYMIDPGSPEARPTRTIADADIPAGANLTFYADTTYVLSGVVFLIIVYRNARRGLYTKERHWPVEAAAVYWHFVDVVWVFFYPALYLIGTVIG